MKSKMWKIFKNKSSSSSISKNENNNKGNNNLYDNVQQDQQQQYSFGTSSTSGDNNNNNNHPHNNSINPGAIKPSKLTKMISSFTLKRNSNKKSDIKKSYNSDVAESIIRSAEINNEICKYNNYNYNNLNKNIKNVKQQKSYNTTDDNIFDSPIRDTSSNLIKSTHSDEIAISPKRDYIDPNFPISPQPTEPIILHSCPICSRKFVQITLDKHIGICEKMASKKRKKFDSFQQRREGTVLADYLPLQSTNNKQQANIEPKILSPKVQVQENNSVSVHKQIDIESENSHYLKKKTLHPISSTKQVKSKNVVTRLASKVEQCPHCNRSFCIKAYDRHVDWCKDKSRLQDVKHNSDQRTAKERLDARTKYRAPNLKPKRDAIKNKYSGYGEDGHSIDDNRSENNIFSMSNSLSSSFMSDGPPEENKNSDLTIKAHKINTETEATIKLKNIVKSPNKPKSTYLKKKKGTTPKPSTKNVEMKDIRENTEICDSPKDELNLTGHCFNFNNESYEDMTINLDNIETISSKNVPIRNSVNAIFPDDKQNSSVDDIEIEEIIPLNLNYQSRPENDFDETPIRPAKRFFNDKSISDLSTNFIAKNDNSPICSAKSNNKENILSELIETEPLKSPYNDKFIINDKLIPISKNDFDNNPICLAKTNLINKSLNLNINSTKNLEDLEKQTVQEKSYSKMDKNDAEPVNTIITDDETLNLQNVKNNLSKTSLTSFKIKDSRDNFQLSSTNSFIKEKPLTENVKNYTKMSIERTPRDDFNDIKILQSTKNAKSPIPKKSKDFSRSSTNSSQNSVVKAKPVHNSIQNNIILTSKTVKDEKLKNNFSNLSKKLNNPKINHTTNSIDHPNLSNHSINIVESKKIPNKTDNSDQMEKKNLKNPINDKKNIRKTYVKKLSIASVKTSSQISIELDNTTPVCSPNAISNNPNKLASKSMKPILINRYTKSVNDIPKHLSKDTYSNNLSQLTNRSSKIISKSELTSLPKIINKKIKEPEKRISKKESLKIILPPINKPSLASLSGDDFDKLLSSVDLINGRKDSQSSLEFISNSKKLTKNISLPKVLSQTSIKTTSSNDESGKFWMDISNSTKESKRIELPKIKNLKSNEEHYNLNSGFSDKYDPFLSAKRQLEELCSPTAQTESLFSPTQYHHTTLTSTPITKKPTSTLSQSYTTPSPNPRNTLTTVKSNFRRTSSLRSPRKTNPCPRPVFVPLSRSRPTTIQSGISDEGPISNNFIRTEEYDEIPVKSACINNCATAINSPQFTRRDSSPQKLLSRSTSRESSPLVIKRDPNSNLNRRNLRLNLGNDKESKIFPTDSLVLFEKYENDLKKNPSEKFISSLSQLSNTLPLALPQQHSTTTTQTVSNLISEKDWKDKSNTISKQNSMKNSSTDLVDKDKITLSKNSLTNLVDINNGKIDNKINDTTKKLPSTINNSPEVHISMPSVNKFLPIKLEPLQQNFYKQNSTPQPSKSQSPPVTTSSSVPLFPHIKSTPMAAAINNNLINLNSIFDNIDPKLINKFDNLQLNISASTNTKLSDDSDLASVGSQDSAYRPKTAPYKLSDEQHSSGHQSSESVIEKSPSPPTTKQRKENYQRQTHSNRNPCDKKRKRQIRLEKNHFLYETFPSDTELGSDQIINKSNDHLLSSNPLTTTHIPLVESSEQQFDSLLSPSNNPKFSDFNFHEILSSFVARTNDEELFPGFKDCKEFLMNNNFLNINNNNNYLNNTQNQSIRSRKIELDPMMMLNDSSTNMHSNNKISSSLDDDNDDDDDDVQIGHDKHEIFISIETDQNENETSHPCPIDPSIQNLKVEEINSNDNKFTKIETYHLPIFEDQDEIYSNKVTINHNNVKNGDITCDSGTSMYPADSDERSSIEYYSNGKRTVEPKTSVDSAFGSLSMESAIMSTDRSSRRRNSTSRNNYGLPINDINVLQQSNNTLKRCNRESNVNTSGLDGSLPPINNQYNRNINEQQYHQENILNVENYPLNTVTFDTKNITTDGQNGMSKFCHNCGNQFLISQAKFCMTCGVKRIIL